MANRKISDLTALTAPVTGDLLPIVDISEAAAADKNKKITVEKLFQGIPGNVGVGVTPSAWSGLTSLSIGSTGSSIASASNDNLYLTSGAYYDGTNWIYKATSQLVSSYQQLSGIHRWNIAAAGTAGNTITFTQAMTLDSSGRLGIGTSSPDVSFVVSNGGTSSSASGGTLARVVGSGVSRVDIVGGNTSFSILELSRASLTAAGQIAYEHSSNSLYFAVDGAQEAVRIDSSKRLLVGASSDSGGALFQVNGDRIRVGTAKTPASASATGTTGEICWDANYIYVCTATNTWKRTAIATW